jgi:hypothetical protein
MYSLNDKIMRPFANQINDTAGKIDRDILINHLILNNKLNGFRKA